MPAHHPTSASSPCRPAVLAGLLAATLPPISPSRYSVPSCDTANADGRMDTCFAGAVRTSVPSVLALPATTRKSFAIGSYTLTNPESCAVKVQTDCEASRSGVERRNSILGVCAQLQSQQGCIPSNQHAVRTCMKTRVPLMQLIHAKAQQHAHTERSSWPLYQRKQRGAIKPAGHGASRPVRSHVNPS